MNWHYWKHLCRVPSYRRKRELQKMMRTYSVFGESP